MEGRFPQIPPSVRAGGELEEKVTERTPSLEGGGRGVGPTETGAAPSGSVRLVRAGVRRPAEAAHGRGEEAIAAAEQGEGAADDGDGDDDVHHDQQDDAGEDFQ